MVLHDPVVRLPPRALSQKDPTRSPAPGGFRSDLSSRSSRGRTLGWHTPSSSRDLLGESHGMPRPIGSKLDFSQPRPPSEGRTQPQGSWSTRPRAGPLTLRSHRRRSEHGHFRERWRYGRRGPRPWNPRGSRNRWRGYRFLRYWLAFPNCLPARHQNPSILEQHRAMAAAGRMHRARGVERAIDAENFCTCEQAVCAFTAGDKNPPIQKQNGPPPPRELLPWQLPGPTCRWAPAAGSPSATGPN